METKRKKKGTLKRILVVLLTVAVLIGFALLDPDVQNIDDVLRQMSPLWLLGALAAVLVYYLGDTVMYLIACRDMGVPLLNLTTSLFDKRYMPMDRVKNDISNFFSTAGFTPAHNSSKK